MRLQYAFEKAGVPLVHVTRWYTPSSSFEQYKAAVLNYPAHYMPPANSGFMHPMLYDLWLMQHWYHPDHWLEELRKIAAKYGLDTHLLEFEAKGLRAYCCKLPVVG